MLIASAVFSSLLCQQIDVLAQVTSSSDCIIPPLISLITQSGGKLSDPNADHSYPAFSALPGGDDAAIED